VARLHGVLGVEVVVKERLAVGGLLQRLRVQLVQLLVNELLLGVVQLGQVRDSHLGEELLQLEHLVRAEVARRGRRRPSALQRRRGARLRSVDVPSAAGLAPLLRRRLDAHQLGILVIAAAKALALLALRGGLLLLDLLLQLRRAVHLRRAGGEPLLVHLAALRTGLEAGAELRRVPLLVAVAALVRQQQRACHLAVLLVLDPVGAELRLRALRVEAEGAEHRVRLRRADSRHLIGV